MCRQIPSGDRPDGTHDDPDDSQNQNVFHGILWREHCGHIATDHSVDPAIDERHGEHPRDEESISDRWKNMESF